MSTFTRSTVKPLKIANMNTRHRTLWALAVFVTAAMVLIQCALPTQAADWKGKETTKDGIRCLVSPREPMEPRITSELEELWRIGGDTDDEDEFFGVILQILTDDHGNVYLLDSQLNQVKVFSPDGEYVREFGREGEGPGEFRFASDMFFTADGNIGVLQAAPGKIILFTPEGEPAGEHPIPTREDGGMVILSNGSYRAGNLVLLAMAQAFSENRYERTDYLVSVDPEGGEKARYHSRSRVLDTANPVLSEGEWTPFSGRWAIGADGRVYVCTSRDDYTIKTWNRDGTPDRIIEREYTHRKRTAEQKKVIDDLFGVFANMIPNGTFETSDYDGDIAAIYVREDGSLWVLTSDGTRDLPDGSLGVFDIFDQEGRLLRQVALNGDGDPETDGYYFSGDRMYVVTDWLQALISLQSGEQSFQVGDEEPEPMSVICYQLAADVQTSQK
ncbi:MAG: 6-bladed beta-propeller [Candidatus Latescibacterota bacterium]|nr:MAG: 6-bladed beta-propeller [Candidatus Latescibacterota bacterium]